MKLMKKYLVYILVVSLSFFVFLPPGLNGTPFVSYALSEQEEPYLLASASDEVKISSRLVELLFGKNNNEEKEAIYLIPGGGIFGAKIKQSCVTVQNPGENHDLKVGAPLGHQYAYLSQ